MPAIKLKNVFKRYGPIQVVHGISVDISEGEFVVLLVPSGCGKTTTLRMVAGLEDVSDGKISIGGRIVNDVAPKDRGVAMVFQDYALYPHITVCQNMEFALRPMKLSADEVERRIRETANILGLSEFLKRKPAQLSGGQRQRVAMGRAMVRTPKVFLFDEPLSNLDAKLRTQVRWEINKLHRRLGTTVLYVTHDQVEAMTLADRIVIMREGHVEQVGTPEEVYARPETTFVTAFIGTPAMNMVEAHISGGKLMTNELTLAVPERFASQVTEGQSVVIGIRPIGLHLVDAVTEGAIKAQVEVTECLGNEVLLNLQVGSHEMIAEVPTTERVASGTSVYVRLNDQDLHIFDGKTGKTLAK